MDLSRYHILTTVEASKRREIYAEKKAYWKKYSVWFIMFTVIVWVVTILGYFGIWFTDVNTGMGYLLGLLIPVYYWLLRTQDLCDWRPPTLEEMNEIGDEII